MDNNILESMYIGDINKSHKGGYKIISSSKDHYIIKKRNFILNELTNVFNGGKQLMYEDIPHYIQALEGKYLRNKIRGGDSISSDKIKGYYKKLVKKSLKDFTGGVDLLNIIKKNSPYLSRKIDKHMDKLIGGEENSNKNNKSLNSYYIQSGGDLNCTNTCKLDKKSDTNKDSYQNGGNDLDQLRQEINKIRGFIYMNTTL